MRTQYVTSDAVSLAYQVLSEEGPTLLHIPGAVSNLALEDGLPAYATYYERLSRFTRLVRFDKRGTGLSDRAAEAAAFADQLTDVEAIREAVEAETVAAIGFSHGGSLAALYAATYPHRVNHLILVDSICCDASDLAQPSSPGNAMTDWDRTLDAMQQDFERFTRGFARLMNPTGSAADHARLADYLRATGSPRTFLTLWAGMRGLDLRPLLDRITAPTLVIHAAGDALVPVEQGRYFAKHIAGAEYLELDSRAHVPHLDERVLPHVLVAIEQFLTGTVRHTAEREFASILFTDMVDSTAKQQAQGDAAWRTVRQRFEADTTSRVEQFGGRVVQFTGDGVMASFPVPGDALRAARTLVADARGLGLDIRAGLHAGETYVVDDALSGICVNIAARVLALAGAGEILTTEVVRGLMEGGGFDFAEIGEVELKGIGPRRVVRLL